MSDEQNSSGSGSDPTKKRRRRRRKGPGAGDAAAPSAPRATPTDKPEASGGRPEGSRRRRGAKPASQSDKPRGRSGPDARRSGRRGAEGNSPRPDRAPQGDKPRESRGRGQEAGSKTSSAKGPSSTANRQEPANAPQRQVSANDDLRPSVQVEERIRWGNDDDAPTKEISALAADLPANPSRSDLDPSTFDLVDDGEEFDDLNARICNVIGVRFVTAGRLYLYDGGEGNYERGDRVVVEADRGERIGTVGAQSTRQPPPRSLKRVLRRATETELASLQGDAQQAHLAKAKALAKDMGLPIKVFRASLESGGRLAIYYSCDDKTDVRRLTRALSDSLPMPVELRHHGVRDEAKLVGGIGSCGMELCCTTWLPAFVPVSIKNAKDQGLVLNPTKVSGQCGRLKCCLVYEQAQYSEMRKGLPKLGKRVITNDGFEGRVIEVDVLHQRFRVSVGRGESKIYQKGEVEPMFASQAQSAGSSNPARPKPEGSDDTTPAPSQNKGLFDKKDE